MPLEPDITDICEEGILINSKNLFYGYIDLNGLNAINDDNYIYSPSYFIVQPSGYYSVASTMIDAIKVDFYDHDMVFLYNVGWFIRGVFSFRVPDNAQYARFSFACNGSKNKFQVHQFMEGIQISNLSSQRIDELSQIDYSFFNQKFSPAHLFIDKIDGVGQLIPNQSLFDIQISHRLGFKVIELNIHQTSDGEFVCIHGVDGKFGHQVEHIDGVTDVSDMTISHVPFSYIQNNIRYKSTYDEYRSTIPTLEQCCELCHQLGMTVFLALTGVSMEASLKAIEICKSWFGHSFIVGTYGEEQAYLTRLAFSGIIQNSSSSIDSKEIESIISKIGKPYIHSIKCTRYSKETSNASFMAIVDAIHKSGGYAGFSAAYTPEELAQRMWNCGFDVAGSSYNINVFEGGNICYFNSDISFSNFLSTGFSKDGILYLSKADTIIPDLDSSSIKPFLAGGLLTICFEGSIIVNMGHINCVLSSDGETPNVLSSYFLLENPTFKITAQSETQIKSISYQASCF